MRWTKDALGKGTELFILFQAFLSLASNYFLFTPSNHFLFLHLERTREETTCAVCLCSLCKCHWGGGAAVTSNLPPTRNGFRWAELDMKCCWNCLKKSPHLLPFAQSFYWLPTSFAIPSVFSLFLLFYGFCFSPLRNKGRFNLTQPHLTATTPVSVGNNDRNLIKIDVADISIYSTSAADGR